MICLLCRQAEIVDGFTSVAFARDEMRLIVKDVPAQICPQCEEAYVEEEIAVRLLQRAQEISRTGILENEIVYGNEKGFLDSCFHK